MGVRNGLRSIRTVLVGPLERPQACNDSEQHSQCVESLGRKLDRELLPLRCPSDYDHANEWGDESETRYMNA